MDNDDVLEDDYLEKHLVPKALLVQDKLLESEDPNVLGDISNKVLDRSAKHGKRVSGNPAMQLNLSAETFSVMVAGLGKMLGVEEKPVEPRNVTPKPKPKSIPKPKPEPDDETIDFSDFGEPEKD